jgi:hypothetical protein
VEELPVLRFASFDYFINNGVENKIVAEFLSGIIEGSLIFTPTEYMKIQSIKNNKFNKLKKYNKKPLILYKGVATTILRTSTNQSIIFKFYYTFNNDLIKNCGNTLGTLLTGSLGDITSVILNNPIDVIKTKMQTDNIKMLKTIKNIIKQNGMFGF